MFRKGYYTINLHLKGEESILLRRVEASRDWYTAINQAANTSRYSTVFDVFKIMMTERH